jgi:hypothetical protein
MPEFGHLWRSVFPMAIGSAAGLGAFAVAAAGAPSDASSIVAQLVAGLAVNFASEKLSELLRSSAGTPVPSLSDDLGRVTKHALLTILYETATGQHADARQAVQQAAAQWDARLFPAADPTERELLELMRQPAPLDDAQSQAIARQLLPPAFAHLQAPYSSAIRHRFALVFEALLRQDDRACRAVTLYLLRLNQADLAALRNTAGQILQLLRHPQPQLLRFDELRKLRRNQFDITDLQFKRRASTFQLPPSIAASLQDWLSSPHPFRVLKLTGAAGMGKSRLALEICDYCHTHHWLAGFVAEQNWPEAWTPICHTVAVLDYAASKSINGRNSFQWLESVYRQVHAAAAQPAPPPAKVRIILIDRSEQGPLWADWRASEIAADLEKVTLAVDLKPSRAEFDAIVAGEFQRRHSRPPSEEEGQLLEKVASRLRDDFRPLFALLTADAAIDTSNAGNPVWSPELLLENILKSQIQKWRTAGLDDADLHLLFEATATQGACNADPDFTARREALSPAKFAALQSLSDPTEGLGPIVPDLLGEFFVLMRLRGEASVGTHQTQVITRQSWEIWKRAWELEPTALFAGLLLQDYLSWTPDKGANPAETIMEQALRRIQDGSISPGLGFCLFAAAWNRPDHCEWSSWLKQGAPQQSRSLSVPSSMGLFNAMVGESDPAKRLALADRIDALHRAHGQEPTVREQLAKALVNATAAEPHSVQRRALANRIDDLHRAHGQEPAVREPLAMALFNATVMEPDPVLCRALVDRIDALHRDHGQEPAVREQLARALCSATVVEPDPVQCLATAERIEALHRDHGEEPAIRELLAKAIVNAIAAEPDPAQRRVLANRIDALHRDHGQEPAVREPLARALCSATVVESDPANRLALVERIETLHRDHGQESAVRKQLAKALLNATAAEPDPAQLRVLANGIAALHWDHGQESAVREPFTGALVSATVVEPDPAQRLALANRIDELHRDHGQESSVREQLAKALVFAALGAPDRASRLALVERIATLHRDHGQEPSVREQLSKVLVLAALGAPGRANRLALVERIETLHRDHGQEPAVRVLLAAALARISHK